MLRSATTNTDDTGDSEHTATAAHSHALGTRLAPRRFMAGGLSWQLGIAALAMAAGVMVGHLLWTAAPDVITRTVPDPAEITIDRIFEDGSGTFGTGRRTLSDGQVIILDGQDFCLYAYGCSD